MKIYAWGKKGWPPGVRLQLTFWYLAVFAGLFLLSGIFLYIQFQASLIADLDATLQVRTQEVAEEISYKNNKITLTPALAGLTRTSFNVRENANFGALTRIVDSHERVFRISPAFRNLQVPDVSVRQPLKEGIPWVDNVRTQNGQEVRLYSIALLDKGHPFAVLQVGQSLVQTQAALNNLVIRLCIIAPFVLIICALGSYWLSSRAFAPVDHLIKSAHHIEATDLHQRVEVPRAHDEIQRLALTLNEMIARLEEAFTRQKRFVANASHELRTPVAVIQTMAETSLLQGFTPEEYSATMKDIIAETERLAHLISDLLALAHADEGQAKLEQEPVHLELLSDAVMMHVELLAQERGITLHKQNQQPVLVMGDEARLIQVILNLIDNAILYTNPGGTVWVSVKAQDEWAYLTVQDTGIGIADEHIGHIFERFYRVDAARVRREGNSSGLGLSIVDWIVKAHGGQIHVYSEPGKGTTFVVVLPLQQARQAL